MTTIFLADSIGKSFGRRTILSAATIMAHAGRITALVGRNGEGKTTLLRSAVGLLAPDHGVVVFRDERHTRPRLARLARRGLYFLPDRGLLSPAMTVREHLTALASRVPEARAAEAIERLALDDFLDRKLRTLSTGERRRVELGMAAARDPLCLLADEPFLAIMPKDGLLVAAVLRALAARGCAVVISGHEVPQLFDLADEVVWQTAGTTHALGPPDAARRYDQFRREYLGPLGS